MKKGLYILYCSKKNGMGHISRFLTIKHFIKDIRFELLVFKEEGTDKIIKELSNELRGIKINYYRKDILKTIKKISNSYDIIFFDKKNTDEDVYKYLKREKKKIIIFDDNKKGEKYSDILFDANIHNKASTTKCFYGEKYIIFNKNIILTKPKKRINKKIKRILVCFGGTDPKNITDKIIKISKDLKQFHFYIFSNKNINNTSNIKIITNKNLLHKYLKKSDLAIISGGLLLYEVLYIGVPIITINQNKDQENNCKYFEEKKIIYNLGIIKKNIEKTLNKIIEELNEDFIKRKRMVKKGKELVDGKGIFRLKKLLERL